VVAREVTDGEDGFGSDTGEAPELRIDEGGLGGGREFKASRFSIYENQRDEATRPNEL
jgi:hypothetical protein